MLGSLLWTFIVFIIVAYAEVTSEKGWIISLIFGAWFAFTRQSLFVLALPIFQALLYTNDATKSYSFIVFFVMIGFIFWLLNGKPQPGSEDEMYIEQKPYEKEIRALLWGKRQFSELHKVSLC